MVTRSASSDARRRCGGCGASLANQTTIVYNAAKQKIADVDQLSYYTSQSYDAAGRPLATQDARGNATTNVWNARDMVATQDALGNRWTMIYDALDRPYVSQTPLGFLATTVYDGAGQTIAMVNGLSYITTQSFDGAAAFCQLILSGFVVHLPGL